MAVAVVIVVGIVWTLNCSSAIPESEPLGRS